MFTFDSKYCYGTLNTDDNASKTSKVNSKNASLPSLPSPEPNPPKPPFDVDPERLEEPDTLFSR